jgi:hypothetical protein
MIIESRAYFIDCRDKGYIQEGHLCGVTFKAEIAFLRRYFSNLNFDEEWCLLGC